MITPAIIRFLVLGVACCKDPQQKPTAPVPTAPVPCQRCQQYELPAIGGGSGPPPSYSKSQSSSSVLAQVPGRIASAATTAALSEPSQIRNAGNSEETDADPPPSTRNLKNYIILTVWACILLLLDLFIPKDRKGITALLAALGLAVTLSFTFNLIFTLR